MREWSLVLQVRGGAAGSRARSAGLGLVAKAALASDWLGLGMIRACARAQVVLERGGSRRRRGKGLVRVRASAAASAERLDGGVSTAAWLPGGVARLPGDSCGGEASVEQAPRPRLG